MSFLDFVLLLGELGDHIITRLVGDIFAPPSSSFPGILGPLPAP